MKILCAALLLFALSYFFNPMNAVMRHSLTGPISVLVRIFTPELMLACGRFLLATLLIGLPGLLLGPLFARHAFLKAGSLSGLVCSTVAVVNYLVLEKGEMEGQAWFVITPFFVVVYFLLGFAGGGFWGLIARKLLSS